MGRAMIGFVDNVISVRYLEVNQFQGKQDKRYNYVIHYFLNDSNIYIFFLKASAPIMALLLFKTITSSFINKKNKDKFTVTLVLITHRTHKKTSFTNTHELLKIISTDFILYNLKKVVLENN